MERRRCAVATPNGAQLRTSQPRRSKIFLVADIRGYTVFTQERGDEAAARLAATFADIVRKHVQDRNGSVVELRVTRRSPCSARLVRPSGRRSTCRLASSRRRGPRRICPFLSGSGWTPGRQCRSRSGSRGGALNLAARLCSELPGEILGSHSLVHLARAVEGVRYIDRGELHPKGLPDPVRVLAITSESIDVPEQIERSCPLDRHVLSLEADPVPRPRADRGGHGRRPDIARRAEATRRPGTSPPPRESARARRHLGRRGLGRRSSRAGTERHPDLRLAPPKGHRTRPHPEPRTRLPPEARSDRAGRHAVRRAHQGGEESPPRRPGHRGYDAG